MTLTMTLAVTDWIYQSSDFRLTSGSQTRDTTFKSLQAGGPSAFGWSWSGLFSYSGVGQIGTMDTSQWLLRLLSGRAHTMSLDEVAALIQQSWKSFVDPARRHLEHTFIIGSFDRGKPRILMLSNTSRVDPRAPGGVSPLASRSTALQLSEDLPAVGSMYITGSGAEFVGADVAALARAARRLPRDHHGSNAIFESLARITKDAARRAAAAGSPSVSDGCWCAAVGVDGPGAARLFGVPGAAYFPPSLQHPLPNSTEIFNIVANLQNQFTKESAAREQDSAVRRNRISDKARKREQYLIRAARSFDRPEHPHIFHRAFIPNRGSNDVTVIDTRCHEQIGSIALKANPTAVAVDPIHGRVYVTQNVNQPHEGLGSVAIIDLVRMELLDEVEVGIAPSSLSLTANGGLLYVANLFSNDIGVIDTQERRLVGWIAVGGLPVSVLAQPNCASLYFVDGAGNQVVEVDRDLHSVKRTLKVGRSPNNLAAAPDAASLIVSNQGSNSVSIISLETLTVREIAVRRSPRGIALRANASEAWVTCVGSDVTSIVDVSSMRGVVDIPVGREPQGVDIDPTDTFAYILNSGDGTASVFDVARRSVVAIVKVGESPVGFGRFLV